MPITPPKTKQTIYRYLWLAILFGCSLVACSPLCEDCPQLLLHFPPTLRNNPSEGAITLDFTLADKKNVMLFLEADAQLQRVSSVWQIKLSQNSGGMLLTTPSYIEVTTPQGKAFAIEYFRIFVPLQEQQLETLYTKGLTFKLHSLGQTFQIMKIASKAVEALPADQVPFQLEATLWLGKLPNQLVCNHTVTPMTVNYSTQNTTPILLSWNKGCSGNIP